MDAKKNGRQRTVHCLSCVPLLTNRCNEYHHFKLKNFLISLVAHRSGHVAHHALCPNLPASKKILYQHFALQLIDEMITTFTEQPPFELTDDSGIAVFAIDSAAAVVVPEMRITASEEAGGEAAGGVNSAQVAQANLLPSIAPADDITTKEIDLEIVVLQQPTSACIESMVELRVRELMSNFSNVRFGTGDSREPPDHIKEALARGMATLKAFSRNREGDPPSMLFPLQGPPTPRRRQETGLPVRPIISNFAMLGRTGGVCDLRLWSTFLEATQYGSVVVPCPNRRADEAPHPTKRTPRMQYRALAHECYSVIPILVAEEHCDRCNLTYLHSSRAVLAQLPKELLKVLNISGDSNLGDTDIIISEELTNLIRIDFRMRQGPKNCADKFHELCGVQSATSAQAYFESGRIFHDRLIEAVGDDAWMCMDEQRRVAHINDRAELLALKRGHVLQNWGPDPYVMLSSPQFGRFFTSLIFVFAHHNSYLLMRPHFRENCPLVNTDPQHTNCQSCSAFE